MSNKHWAVVLAGVALVVTLYLLRSKPAQTNAFQALISEAKDSLSSQNLRFIDSLEAKVPSKGSEKNKLDAYRNLENGWNKIGNPTVAAVYTFKRTPFDTSVADIKGIADQMMQAVDYGRKKKLNQNLLFVFIDNAAKSYEHLLSKDPDDEDAQIGLALLDIEGRGRVMQGVQRLLALVKKDSLDPKANFQLGRLNMVNGQYDKAVMRMKRVLKTEPDNLAAIIVIGNAYSSMGDKANAIRYLEKALPGTSGDVKDTIEKRLKELKK